MRICACLVGRRRQIKNIKIAHVKLQDKVIKFRDKRAWAQFHNPKDVAISLSLEASELLEHMQWKNASVLKKYLKTKKSAVADEMADIYYWLLLLSHDLGIDLDAALERKLVKNARRYPVSRARGSSKKYTEL
jgi:dCTP diphosphatase